MPDVVDTPVDAVSGRVAAVRAAFARGVTQPLAWRRAQLAQLAKLVTENTAALAAALQADLGATDVWIHSIELETVHAELREARAHLDAWASPKSVPTPLIAEPASSAIHYQPYGVVLLIAPWNYPVSLVLCPLIAALAAGNAVVVKPSEVSAHVAELLGALLPRYLDPAALAVVQGGVAPTTALLAERFDFICYTGNGTVARIVHAAATKHLTPLLLELGGKCPAIVTPAADVAKAARRIVWGKFSLNMGQTCVSPDYIAVTPANREEVTKAVLAAVREFYGDNPRESPDVSRIINERHTRRLAQLLDDSSVTVLCGGDSDPAARYFAPTVVSAPRDARVMADEIFGPILPIIEFPSVDAILAHVNAHDKPLALYVFSEAAAEQQLVLRSTSSGGACINDVVLHVGNPDLPFGGVGGSGMGAYHGEIGFQTFSHRRAVLKKYGADPSLRFPPYTPSKKRWLLRLQGLSKAKVAGIVALCVLCPPVAIVGGIYFCIWG